MPSDTEMLARIERITDAVPWPTMTAEYVAAVRWAVERIEELEGALRDRMPVRLPSEKAYSPWNKGYNCCADGVQRVVDSVLAPAVPEVPDAH